MMVEQEQQFTPTYAIEEQCSKCGKDRIVWSDHNKECYGDPVKQVCRKCYKVVKILSGFGNVIIHSEKRCEQNAQMREDQRLEKALNKLKKETRENGI